MKNRNQPSSGFITGSGVSSSNLATKTKYETITFNEICDLAKSPKSVPKTDAAWFIASCYNEPDARNSQEQKDGEYVCLVLDIDEGDHDLEFIERVLIDRLGPTSALIYSTYSATSDDKRWRIEPPLVCRMLIYLSYAAMSDLSRAA